MQTRSLISLAKKSAPNWTRDNIREIVSEVHYLMMAKELVAHLVTDSTTGIEPLFETTAGTYTYSINTANGFSDDAWRVEQVIGTYGEDTTQHKNVLKIEATISSVAKVVFGFDPSGSKYFIRYYKKPTTISSETIEMEIPERFHMTHVLEGVMGMIERIDSGRSERWLNFEGSLLPSFWNEMSDGKYPNEMFVTPRGY